MPEKRRGFPTWGYLLVGALAFAAFYFIRNMGQQTILKAMLGKPADLLNKSMQSARVSSRITNRTGPITAKNFKVENLSATKDTLLFRFLLDGERADATVRLWMSNRPSGDWKIVKSDTTFSQ